ncbi:FKBP-type peptidyl-prolyl cis-trans isomerase [Microbacterium dextranolyticum]|uniref:peptidylprolyl isomerase n=1 Tax=Microbacterium dextranolyticum TaxID=36806 RepID=A0A9W6M753_9MICO|nr:FKBP-type peptidyl-prolyl cis-trans isomerase [Microbacterium dextranolyticum]MBM7463628.1 peptidylprolyl isomerase [Microbacterium dextranolyticum]GLJ96541.1 peptidylprolyl isomerase [Microbacterium dextranolyticum]
MRLRPLAALSAAALSALLLAGCAGGGTATPSDAPQPSASAAVDLCAAQAAAGAASDAVTVTGDIGKPAAGVEFTSPLEVSALQVTQIAGGSGTAVKAGDFVSFGLTAYDASTGQKLGEQGYEPASSLPQQISADNPIGKLFGCAKPGARVVAAFPASENASAQVYVVDLLAVVPTAAWGAQQAPVAGMPTVTLDADGTPNITIDTSATPPAETEVATLKKGDGYTVQSGDSVLIQFRGARWSSGKLFDGGDTWASAAPYAGRTTGFVPGFTKALEGQTVGSQVLVVIPPKDGYGDGQINDKDLKGDTLVFVIDIIAAQKAQPTQ